MMKQILALVALAGILSAGLVACSSNSPSSSAEPMAPKQAVVATNGGHTTIFLESSDPDNPVMLSTTGDPVCPECRAAAIKYFKTGVLDPHCSTCGANRYLAKPIEIPNVSHN